jgi:hypothetical protein
MGLKMHLWILVGAVIAAAFATAPVSAHHSFLAEFDGSKPVTLNGTITKIEWMNPHAYLYVDVADPQSKATANWAVELGSPNGLTRLGWRRTTLKVGDAVTIEGSLGRFKPLLANARAVTITATGQRFGAASSEGAK